MEGFIEILGEREDPEREEIPETARDPPPVCSGLLWVSALGCSGLLWPEQEVSALGLLWVFALAALRAAAIREAFARRSSVHPEDPARAFGERGWTSEGAGGGVASTRGARAGNVTFAASLPRRNASI